MKSPAEQKISCGCHYCSTNLPFDLPNHLVDELLNGNLVIFAGAGISTENANVLPYTLFQEICTELDIGEKEYDFPEVMQKYCDSTNGRINLIDKIKSRFDHVESFPSILRAATSFHQSLSSLYLIDTIVTTNWDTFFEDYCGATPFVTDNDIAFWNSKGRKVLKLHGSITNYGELVATSQDYAACLKRLHKELLGAILKGILASKTVVYIGYSLDDYDFTRINDFVGKQLKKFQRQSYIVTPFPKETDDYPPNVEVLKTSGVHFIQCLKYEAYKHHRLVSDDALDEAYKILYDCKKAHFRVVNNIRHNSHPEVIGCLAYQDGLTHALEKFIHENNGDSSNPQRLTRALHSYERIRTQKIKQKKYDDASYVDGYMNGLFFFASYNEEPKIGPPPLYYLYGFEEDFTSWTQFNRTLRSKSRKRNRSAIKRFRTLAEEVDQRGEDLVYHHPAWLL